MKPDFDRRQLMALIFVSSLAPAVRLIPKFNTQTAGSASWVAPIVALPFLVLYVWFLSAFLAERHSGEGLGEMIMRTNGRALGSVVLGGTAAFLIFCCGFILRSGCSRARRGRRTRTVRPRPDRRTRPTQGAAALGTHILADARGRACAGAPFCADEY